MTSERTHGVEKLFNAVVLIACLSVSVYGIVLLGRVWQQKTRAEEVRAPIYATEWVRGTWTSVAPAIEQASQVGAALVDRGVQEATEIASRDAWVARQGVPRSGAAVAHRNRSSRETQRTSDERAEGVRRFDEIGKQKRESPNRGNRQRQSRERSSRERNSGNEPDRADQKATTKPTQYVVRDDDSYWSLAERFLGSGMRHAEIEALNPGTPAGKLRPGARIWVPGTSGTSDTKRKSPTRPVVHVVERGDTLGKISLDYLKSARHWKRIYDANRDVLNSPDVLPEGARLKIPGA